MSNNRFVVVGAGAVGGSIAALLADAGLPSLLVARGQHGDHIRSQGLRLKMPDRTLEIKLPSVANIQEVEWQPGDIAVVATKLNDAQQAMTEVHRFGGSSVPIVCATNGIDAEQWVGDYSECGISMVIWMPALFLAPGEVRLYCEPVRGVLDVGPARPIPNQLDPRLEELATLLRLAGFDSQVRPDIQRWKYGKWISNLANAAQALIVDDWKSVARLARHEGMAVLDKLQIDYVDRQTLADRCQGIHVASIDDMSRPGGSTWQSYQRGKPLETPWIEGAMARLGRSCNLATPMLDCLCRLADQRNRVTAEQALALMAADDPKLP